MNTVEMLRPRFGDAEAHAASPRRTTSTAVVITALTLVLTLLGLVMVLSASSYRASVSEGTAYHFLFRQVVAALIGGVAFLVAARFPYQRWRAVAGPLLVLSVAVLGVVLIPSPISMEVNGARRWLGVGALQFQPSELAKFALVLFSADLMSSRRKDAMDPAVPVRWVMGVFGVMGALVMLQPDLGTTVVLLAMAVAVLLAGGGQPRILAAYAFPALLAGVVSSLLTGFRRRRLLAFWDPWKHSRTWGYQTLQSQVALADGGLVGVGLGRSHAKYQFLPEAHTDFIFAVIGEELGYLGALVVLGLFAALFAAGIRAGREAPDRFGTLLAVGLSTWIGLQAVINVGVATGALPNKGITLPFVSYGGSSLVLTLFAAGVLVNIAGQGS